MGAGKRGGLEKTYGGMAGGGEGGCEKLHKQQRLFTMLSSVSSKRSIATNTTASSSVSSSGNSLSYPKKKIAIFNLPYNTTELELTQHCCQLGLILNVVILKASDGGSRGFAFVTFENEEDASFALQAVNGHPMKQRTLRADWSKDQPKLHRRRPVYITTRGGPPKRR